MEKLHNFCYECNNKPRPTPASPKKPSNSLERSSKSRRTISSSLKDIRERYREEAKVIENCLKANTLLTKKELQPFDIQKNNNNSRKESPVFDPSHYAFHGYPHLRTRVNSNAEFRYFGGGGIKNRGSRNFPLFGGATENNYENNNKEKASIFHSYI